jgi:3-methylcrotonyl-CoA carboxylase alpha subunit
MFPSVLIANRGEIAVRVARTAWRLGIRTIAVYSEADAGALHTRVCDEAHLIGPPAARDSYLAIDRILQVAKATNAACIHPGYGFLSENAEFAEACAAAGIIFVGPTPDAMRAMGLKDRAKALMAKAGVPVVPGYHGERQEPSFLKQKAYEVGYPALIKAVAGGGGKGMRRVDKHADFETALESAQREAQSSFGDPRVLIEKYVAAPRHIEVQVFGDRHGNVIHLNERDCSLQRRHQKVVEEAPAPGMTPEMRAAMGKAAVEAARAVGYVGAGTIEFIADGSSGLSPEKFWFMEMNTRLQVEHPVTEAVTGLDLVEWQFRIANGDALPLRQQDVPLDGHAIEARLYAEDPENGFLPSTGKLVAFETPNNVRVDTGFQTGSAVSPYYDAMIAKLIVHAPDRRQAIALLGAALEQTIVAGPRSNTAFLARLVRSPEFGAETFDTGFIERNLAPLGAVAREPDFAAAAQGIRHLLTAARSSVAQEAKGDIVVASPWDTQDGFQLSGLRRAEMPFLVDGKPATAVVRYDRGDDASILFGGRIEIPLNGAAVIDDGDTVYVIDKGRQTVVARVDFGAEGEADGSGGMIRAPMHGKVLAILTAKGNAVRKGERVAILEAMKMEHALVAPFDGTVTEVAVAEGSQVAERASIMIIEPVT